MKIFMTYPLTAKREGENSGQMLQKRLRVGLMVLEGQGSLPHCNREGPPRVKRGLEAGDTAVAECKAQ